MVGNLQAWLARFKASAYARRPPLVLLNGLCEQPESWFRNAPFWRRSFDVHLPNVLAYDGPGLHAHLDAGGAVTVAWLVEQLHLYLERFVQAPPYHLCAASLGGKVAVEFAVKHPHLVGRMVLLCPSGLGGEERLPIVEGVRRNDLRSMVDSVFHDARCADPGLLAYYTERFNDRRWKTGLLRTIRGTRDHCVRDRLAQVAQPTLLVSGRDDKIVDAKHAAEAAKLLPQGYYLSVPGCGHAPQMEQPWLVNRLVTRFLTSPRPSAHPKLSSLLSPSPNTLL